MLYQQVCGGVNGNVVSAGVWRSYWECFISRCVEELLGMYQQMLGGVTGNVVSADVGRSYWECCISRCVEELLEMLYQQVLLDLQLRHVRFVGKPVSVHLRRRKVR
jgi:hypothetical protein